MRKGNTGLASFHLKLNHSSCREERRPEVFFFLELPKPQNKDSYTLLSFPPSVPVAWFAHTIKKMTKLNFLRKYFRIILVGSLSLVNYFRKCGSL
jgi:hypothetical protein